MRNTSPASTLVTLPLIWPADVSVVLNGAVVAAVPASGTVPSPVLPVIAPPWPLTLDKTPKLTTKRGSARTTWMMASSGSGVACDTPPLPDRSAVSRPWVVNSRLSAYGLSLALTVNKMSIRLLAGSLAGVCALVGPPLPPGLPVCDDDLLMVKATELPPAAVVVALTTSVPNDPSVTSDWLWLGPRVYAPA